MADYSAKDVAALRKETGAGMMDCKKALEESGGNLEDARDWLRKKGLAGATKRAGRSAEQGAVDVVVDGNVAALVEITCETDFVAKGDDFRTLVASLASQAMMGLGAYGDPQTGRVVVDVVGAQFAIDLLGVLEEKTKGNLTPEEATELTEVLAQLRSRFVYVAKLVASQMQARAQAGAPDIAGSIGLGGGPSAGGSAGASGLIMPD